VRTFFVIGFDRDAMFVEEEGRGIPCCMVPIRSRPYEVPFEAKPPYFVTYSGPRETACAGPFEFPIEAWDYAVAHGGILVIPDDGTITVVDKRGRPIVSV
jgi:hypothetical protein